MAVEVDDDRERLRLPPRILITGSEGIIGKAIFEEVDHYPYYQKDKVWGLDKKSGVDITDLEALNVAVKSIHPDYIIHLAANSKPEADWEDIFPNNIIGTRNVYEAARRNGVKRVIFASSTHIVGAYKEYPGNHPATGLYTADTPVKPDSSYGLSKVFGEALASQYYSLYGIESICIRIGVVTPDDKPLPHYEKLWLSHRDAAQVFRKALSTPVLFGIYYATSEIPDPIFDIEPTKRDLGFEPQDTLQIP